MGEVFLAHDTELKRPVAIKFLIGASGHDLEARQKLRHEAQTAAALDHPNICSIYQVGIDEQGRDFIAMQYIEGETLSSRLRRGPLSVRAALDLAYGIATALDVAHRRGVIHRDLKPQNIMSRRRECRSSLTSASPGSSRCAKKTRTPGPRPSSNRFAWRAPRRTWPRKSCRVGRRMREATCSPWVWCSISASPVRNRLPRTHAPRGLGSRAARGTRGAVVRHRRHQHRHRRVLPAPARQGARLTLPVRRRGVRLAAGAPQPYRPGAGGSRHATAIVPGSCGCGRPGDCGRCLVRGLVGIAPHAAAGAASGAGVVYAGHRGGAPGRVRHRTQGTGRSHTVTSHLRAGAFTPGGRAVGPRRGERRAGASFGSAGSSPISRGCRRRTA